MMRRVRATTVALVCTATVTTLLPSSASAAVSVNRGAMAKWAKDWSVCHVVEYSTGACVPYGNRDPEVKYGPAYAVEFDNDCTDFVSDALHLGGGMPMDDTRWYTKRRPLFWHTRTHSWSVVKDWNTYWRTTVGAATWVSHMSPTKWITDAHLGDVILYNFANGHGYDHLSVETGYGDATWQDVNGHDHSFHGDLVSQHTTARRNSPWNLGYLKEQNPTRRAVMRQKGWYIIHWSNAYNGW